VDGRFQRGCEWSFRPCEKSRGAVQAPLGTNPAGQLGFTAELFAQKIQPANAFCFLERGDYLSRKKNNWNSSAVFLESKYRAKEAWYDKDGNTSIRASVLRRSGNTTV